MGITVFTRFKLNSMLSKSTTDWKARSNLIGKRKGTSSSTTVASKSPECPPSPIGIKVTPTVVAFPPTPWARAGLSSQQTFKP